MQLCFRFCYKQKKTVDEPEKMDTPYGGRLIYTLPGGNKLVVHLKDKTKIRIKKRWSQVMYMFYLLGFKNFENLEDMLKLYEDVEETQAPAKNEFLGFGNLLKKIDSSIRKKVKNGVFRKPGTEWNGMEWNGMEWNGI